MLANPRDFLVTKSVPTDRLCTVSLCFTPCSAQAAWQSPACLGVCLVAVQTPVASFEDEEKEFTIISKFIGELCDLIRRFALAFAMR
jgi:hypothetical protein